MKRITKKEKLERQKIVIRMRKQRYKYREIGEKLHLTKQRVQQIFEEKI